MTASEVSDFKARDIETKNIIKDDNLYKNVSISGKYKSSTIAKIINTDLNTFNKLNPNLDRQLATGKSYELRLPIDKLSLFNDKRVEILNESVKDYLNY